MGICFILNLPTALLITRTDRFNKIVLLSNPQIAKFVFSGSKFYKTKSNDFLAYCQPYQDRGFFDIDS